VAELVELQGDYQAWLDGLPPSLADSATADALRAICDLAPVPFERSAARQEQGAHPDDLSKGVITPAGQ